MSTPESRLASFVAAFGPADLTGSAAETVRRAFIDTLGVTLAGTREAAGRRVLRRAGLDPATVDLGDIIGTATTALPAEVALWLGTAGHALDYDDLSWAMDGHPSVTLVPAILATAGAPAAPDDLAGSDLVAAYAAGFETMCGLADPSSPEHYEAGWHTRRVGTPPRRSGPSAPLRPPPTSSMRTPRRPAGRPPSRPRSRQA